MAGSSFTGPLSIKKADGSKVTFVNADGDLVAGTTIVFGSGDTLDDTNGNELMEFTVVASAVNHLGVTNAATGNSPILEAVGGDTNIDVELTPKGTGNVKATTGGFETATETVTTGSPALTVYGATQIDSSGGAITGTLGAGTFVGQIKTIVMTDATTSSTISIANHQTSDPEVATFDAVDETGVFLWSGTEWITLFATCTFV